MPTYKNNREAPIYVGGKLIKPGETATVDRYVYIKNVDFVSEDPALANVLLSDSLSMSNLQQQEVAWDSFDLEGKNIGVDVVCRAGSVDVFVNSTSGKQIHLEKSETLSLVFESWKAHKIIIEATEDSTKAQYVIRQID